MIAILMPLIPSPTTKTMSLPMMTKTMKFILKATSLQRLTSL